MKKITTKEWIKRARKIHGDKYDYSKTKYKGTRSKVCIICPKHGEFWQTPANHLSGNGCMFCSSEQNISEGRLFDELIHLINDEIVKQKKFKWLRHKNPMSIDIYIPSKKIGIEYQGDQHFKKIEWYGGEESFNKQLERDIKKIQLCQEHNIKLLHFTYNNKIVWDKYKVYTNIDDLIKEINGNF